MSAATAATVTPIKPYPEFEGHPIEYVVTKVSGAVTVPEDVVLHQDDRIRLISEWRVTDVSFKVDKDGKYYRLQHIAHFDVPGAATTAIVPWDPSDATDDGIVHSVTCPGVAP